MHHVTVSLPPPPPPDDTIQTMLQELERHDHPRWKRILEAYMASVADSVDTLRKRVRILEKQRDILEHRNANVQTFLVSALRAAEETYEP